MSNLHDCPAHSCTVRIPANFAFCRKHWYMLPPVTRHQILRLYIEARGSAEHLAALADASRWLAERESALGQAKEDLEAIKRRKRAMAREQGSGARE